MGNSNKDRFLAGEVFRVSEDSYSARFIQHNNSIMLVENGKDTEELCKATSTAGSGVEYEGVFDTIPIRGLLIYDNMIFGGHVNYCPCQSKVKG